MSRMFVVAPANAALLSLLFAACSDRRGGDDQPSISEQQKVFKVRGIVRGTDAGAGTVTIEHEEIPGFMPAMTMPFNVKDIAVLDQLQPGEAIEADFVVTDNDSWLTGIRAIDKSSLRLPNSSQSSKPAAAHFTRLKEGDQLRKIELTDQSNKPVNLTDYAGKQLVLTFIFTRCPVPNFCPLLSTNFSQLQTEIAKDPDLAERTRLLSISIDPEFDTPEVLATYAENFDADPKIWRFATGAPQNVDWLKRAFSVYVNTDSGSIEHGLCTALLDGRGVIQKIWRGNRWEPSEVLATLRNEPSQ